jgi:hypothetical protein
MRTIQLMVAAFSMNNKKTGKDAINRAERLKLISPTTKLDLASTDGLLSLLWKKSCATISSASVTFPLQLSLATLSRVMTASSCGLRP